MGLGAKQAKLIKPESKLVYSTEATKSPRRIVKETTMSKSTQKTAQSTANKPEFKPMITMTKSGLMKMKKAELVAVIEALMESQGTVSSTVTKRIIAPKVKATKAKAPKKPAAPKTPWDLNTEFDEETHTLINNDGVTEGQFCAVYGGKHMEGGCLGLYQLIDSAWVFQSAHWRLKQAGQRAWSLSNSEVVAV